VPAVHPGRDSYIAMALVLSCWPKRGKTVSQMRDTIPNYALLKEKIPRAAPSRFPKPCASCGGATRRARSTCSTASSWSRRCLGARPAFQHEPVLRVSAEAPTREAAARLLQDTRAVIVPALGLKL